MDDRPAKSRGFGVFIIVVDRMLVARECSEGKDVCLGDFSPDSPECLTLAEIFKKELCGFSLHSCLPFLPAPSGPSVHRSARGHIATKPLAKKQLDNLQRRQVEGGTPISSS